MAAVMPPKGGCEKQCYAISSQLVSLSCVEPPFPLYEPSIGGVLKALSRKNVCNLGGFSLRVCYVRGAVKSRCEYDILRWTLSTKLSRIKIQQSKGRVYRLDRDYAPSTIIDAQNVLSCGATLSC